MRCLRLELIQNAIRRRPKHAMYFVHLVKLIFAGEERALGDHFEEDASIAPKVHLQIVIAVGHETLRGAIPASRDVFSIRLLGVGAYDSCKAYTRTSQSRPI